jgi:ribosome maturation factor RimP
VLLIINAGFCYKLKIRLLLPPSLQPVEGTQVPSLFIRLFMDLAGEIRERATSLLKSDGHFIVDVILSFKKIPRKVVVILDGDKGVTIDACAELSRDLAKVLDEDGLIEDAYMLEVSTPGLDHPLVMKRQYYKNTGRKLRVKTKERTEEGVLTNVTEEAITLLQVTGTGKKKEEKTIQIPFTDIEKTFVLVSFK